MTEQPDFELLPKAEPPPSPSPSRGGAHNTTSPQSKRRIALALVVAVVSDFLSAWLEFLPPVQWTLDGVTALLLFLILGRQWVILPALVAEAIPGVAVFPVWVLVVVSVATWGHLKPPGSKS